MKIIYAKGYGFRVAMGVCHSPDEPEFIHQDGSPHPAKNVDGCPHSRDKATGKENQDEPGCVRNWVIEEVTWTNNELITISRTGKPRRKTPTELLQEVPGKLQPRPSAVFLDNLVGKTL